MTSQPTTEFLTSSGTSGGERKLLPVNEDDLRRRYVLYSLLTPVLSQFYPEMDKSIGMYFLYVKAESKTPCGLPARPVLTSYFKSSQFKNRPYDPCTHYTSPNETILCSDSYQSMYSQLLCGLCQNTQVSRVGATFASGFVRSIRFFEKHWQSLANDIRLGTLSSMITDQSVRESVFRILKPDPNLAEFIEMECSKDNWQGIITRLWPNTKYVEVIVTGTMSQYIPVLDYYSNGLPLVCTMYASSECFFGVNLNPICKPCDVSYTIIPTFGFFEFIPFDENDDNSPTEEQELVDLADVKLGQEYELVVTTYSGLYRYKVGDVLRVVGFKNSAPQFSFVCRKSVVLSIDSDKTDEVELQNAVSAAASHLVPFDATLSDYTSYADATTNPGHYVLFWEVLVNGTTSIPPSVFEECCSTVEESLNSVYRQGRFTGAIDALEIKLVEPGTFDKLMDFAISIGASINQYKTPRCLKFAAFVELMRSKSVTNFFSPKCPKWVSDHKMWGN